MFGDIVCDRIGDLDRIRVEGVLDEETALKLAKTIGELRQNGADCILWDGTGLTKVEPHASSSLIRPLNVFRHLGGRIAGACFSRGALHGLEQSRWRKHLNLFRDEDEALRFLKGPAPKTEIVPVIMPEADPVEEPPQSPTEEVEADEAQFDPNARKPNEIDLTKFDFDEDKIDEQI